MSDDGTGRFGPPTPVIQRPYHLSYPFVFDWQGEHYLIPESADNRTIELYRCKRFPDEWEFVHNLMENIQAYDSTLLEHGGRWWLFANTREHAAASSWDELSIFHADHPLSRNWSPHPDNPVTSDVRCARPAGPVFECRGRLIRPSQDSSRRYGYALKFNEIVELNQNSYRETTVERLEPGWNRSIRAVHSFSRAGGLSFIDAICRSPGRPR